MKQAAIIVAFLLAMFLGIPMLANAQAPTLGDPIVALMPHVAKLGDALELNDQQQARLAAWKAEAPQRREALEAAALATREQLRDAILNGAERMRRETLKKQLAAQRTRLIEMRSLCTHMLRQTLTDEQFAKVVASYRATGQTAHSAGFFLWAPVRGPFCFWRSPRHASLIAS